MSNRTAEQRAIFHVESDPDGYGRQRFTLEWWQDGLRRGQCFNAVLSSHIKNMEAAGFKVEVRSRDTNLVTA